MSETADRRVSVRIDRPADEVSAFAGDPAKLPRWAAGLATGIRREGERWVADSPMGTIEVRFVSEEPGVLDHVVVFPDGTENLNPLRVIADDEGSGSEIVFTVLRREGQSDEQFEADVAAVRADLEKLRELLS
ncbi:SRPBCC family protein [Schumannella luteola]|uniref:SRPBCC family protein n=1 Tax=Schumannella luteola TaxID=472059 RepID=A0A852YJL7_9MICO|nr:SRPBCC family protein [Schumannella luteola]NYG99338.1 hypothetical protein [Schumannella luteola]TPX06068.1 SRPBCC family protein [Schumannella luteola]